MSHPFLDANRTRKPLVAVADFGGLDLSPENGFLLSQIDGTLTCGELLHVLPFPPADVGERLERLHRKGVIRFHDEPARGRMDAAPSSVNPTPSPAKTAPPATQRPTAPPPAAKPVVASSDWDDWDDIPTTGIATKAPADQQPTAPPPAAKAAEPATPTIPPVGEDEEVARLRRRMRIQKKLHTQGDPFTILGVKAGAKPNELREAFHRLSLLFHPDRYFRLNLPDDLKAELEDLFGEIQMAFDQVSDPEKRRAAAKAKARGDRGDKTPAEAATGQTAPKRHTPQTADAEALVALANNALAHGQYAAARLNFKLAAQLEPGADYENRAKLVELLEKVEARIKSLLDNESLPDPDEVRHVEETLAKIAPILPDVARLLREFCIFLYLHGDDFQLLRMIYGRLRKLNKMPDTLILGARIFIKGGMPQTALDLLDEAKAHEATHPEIKRLRKEAKRRLSL